MHNVDSQHASKAPFFRKPFLNSRGAFQGWGRAGIGNVSYENQWHPVAMALSCFSAAVLTVTWLFEPGRGLWDQLDVVVFRTLNNTLAWGKAWQSVWAITNWRPFDMVTGAAILLILLATVKHAFTGRATRGWLSLAMLIAATFAAKLFAEFMIDHALIYHRPSPTKVLSETWRLSTLVTWVNCKDTSPWSFPGDHGIVLLLAALYTSYFGNHRLKLAAWLVATIAMLPRLVGGAHWATDVVVGSGTMALLVSAFLFATPVHDWILDHMPSRPAGGHADTDAAPQRIARAA